MHLKPCVERKEDNYFFALSKYQHKLEELLTSNPDFVRPSYRLNEVRFNPMFYMLLFNVFVVVELLYIITNYGGKCKTVL